MNNIHIISPIFKVTDNFEMTASSQEDIAETLREPDHGNPPDLEAAHALKTALGLSSTSKRTTSNLDVQVSNPPDKRTRLTESEDNTRSEALKRLLGLEVRVNFDELATSPTANSLNTMPTSKMRASSQFSYQQLPGGYLQTGSSELNSPNQFNKNVLPPLRPSEGCSAPGHILSKVSTKHQNFDSSIPSTARKTWEISFSFKETSDTEEGDDQDEEQDPHAQPQTVCILGTINPSNSNTCPSSDLTAEEQDSSNKYFHDESTEEGDPSDQETEDYYEDPSDSDEETREGHLSSKTEILHKLSIKTGNGLSPLPTTKLYSTSADGKLAVLGQHQGEPEDKWDLIGRLPKCHWHLSRLRGRDLESLKGGGKETGMGGDREMQLGLDEMIGTSGSNDGDGIPRIVITTPEGGDFKPTDLRWYGNDWDEDEDEEEDEDEDEDEEGESIYD